MSVAGQAQEVLERLVGPGAVFRPGQLDAIAALVEERRRVLVVQRTGWGKSAVYFVATRLLRDAGAGPTLLVSPLLSLMRNQIDAAERAGIRAVRITSDNRDDWSLVEEHVRNGEIDLLLVAPERFANARFRSEVLVHISQHVGLFVIDEAHCISDWGHYFRPDYRRLARTLDLLPTGVPVLCTTATANDRVVDDIVDQLGADLLVLRGPLDRESLALDVIHLPTQPQRLAWLARTIPQLPGTGIVYTLTVHDARRTAAWLRKCGIAARSYSGEEPPEDRLEVEALLLTIDI
jgi:ATP-dependent DNA helicase RecQ